MEWYDYILAKQGVNVVIFGKESLMRVNYKDNEGDHELVVSLDDYRVITHTVTQLKSIADTMSISTSPNKLYPCC